MRKGKDPDPEPDKEPDPDLWLMDPDPGDPKHADPEDPVPDPQNCIIYPATPSKDVDTGPRYYIKVVKYPGQN